MEGRTSRVAYSMMVGYAAHAFSVAMGKPMAPVRTESGEIGFVVSDGQMSERPHVR